MTLRRWDNDEELLDDLANAVRATRPMSEWVERIGVEAFAWHDIDRELELASLVYDSSLDPELVTRDAPTDAYRTVLFEASSASVQIEKSGDRMLGQLIPPGSRVISLVTAGGETAEAEVDEVGCFSFDTLPDEPVRLRWQTPRGALVSEWFRL